jgi:SET domain-containing protein
MMLIKTRVRRSAIHGLGLFAEEFVPRGTPVWRFVPEWDREFTPHQIAAFPLPAQRHVQWFAFRDAARDCWVLGGDGSIFMNHAVQPNTGAPPAAVAPVTTVALRDIAAGEELTCDYFAFDAAAAQKLSGGA